MRDSDVVIIGAGAAGLMCAATAAARGRRVVVLEHARKPGNKVRMAGGGRCNFTNMDVGPEHYLCANPHFVKSALSRFTQWDFLALVAQYNIPYHERDHGQLFCDDSSADILNMLLSECCKAGATIELKTEVTAVEPAEEGGGFIVHTNRDDYSCQSLVVATGGLSIPTAGAGPFGYRVAEQFGVPLHPTRAGLVPFTLQPQDKERFAPLSGIAVPCEVSNERASFRENVLITHRGLSGPAILQISNYWQPGESVSINWLPDHALPDDLLAAQQEHPRQQLKTVLGHWLPNRLLSVLLDQQLLETPLKGLSAQQLQQVAESLQHHSIKPGGIEGYRTAEVTIGGVDCNAVSSKTFEAHQVAGLYFIGEVLDVTGWLGGYNLQWAWSSGWCAGQFV